MSLSELLISLFLSTLLTCVLLQQYASLSHHNKKQMELFDHHFDQTLITSLLKHSITHAGFLPCGSQSNFDIWDSRQSSWVKYKALITHPNQIVTHYMDGKFQPLTAEYANYFVVHNLDGLQKNQMILLTNCHYSELNQIYSIQNYGNSFRIKLTYPTQFIVDSDSYIGGWHHDQLEYKQGILWYGHKKKERLTNKIRTFKVTKQQENLVHVSWRYEHLPAIEQFIFPENIMSEGMISAPL